jgi:hypothetical protein
VGPAAMRLSPSGSLIQRASPGYNYSGLGISSESPVSCGSLKRVAGCETCNSNRRGHGSASADYGATGFQGVAVVARAKPLRS